MIDVGPKGNDAHRLEVAPGDLVWVVFDGVPARFIHDDQDLDRQPALALDAGDCLLVIFEKRTYSGANDRIVCLSSDQRMISVMNVRAYLSREPIARTKFKKIVAK